MRKLEEENKKKRNNFSILIFVSMRRIVMVRFEIEGKNVGGEGGRREEGGMGNPRQDTCRFVKWHSSRMIIHRHRRGFVQYCAPLTTSRLSPLVLLRCHRKVFHYITPPRSPFFRLIVFRSRFCFLNNKIRNADYGSCSKKEKFRSSLILASVETDPYIVYS